MLKTSLLAVAAIATLAVALPAQANSLVSDDVQIGNRSASATLTSLHYAGVNAVSVETWGDVVKALVADESGKTTIRFFTKDTLQPIAN